MPENIYRTTVLKEKQFDFMHFLQNLGITKEFITLTETRGDYCFYDLDLSNKDIQTRLTLNKHQVDFL